MNKQELVKDLKNYAGSSFLTRQNFAKYMGIKNPQNIDKYLRGLERVDGKYYFIPDIAEALKARCEI